MTYSDMIADLREKWLPVQRPDERDLERLFRNAALWSRIVDMLEETGKYIEAERACLDSEVTWTPEAQGNLQNAANAIYENFQPLFTTWQRLQGEIQP